MKSSKEVKSTAYLGLVYPILDILHLYGTPTYLLISNPLKKSKDVQPNGVI